MPPLSLDPDQIRADQETVRTMSDDLPASSATPAFVSAGVSLTGWFELVEDRDWVAVDHAAGSSCACR